MPRITVSESMPASSLEVFNLVHDYSKRLEWDTLLSEAYLVEAECADVGVVTVCKGKRRLLGLELATRYVSYQPGKVAAVKLCGRTPFFETFAASIRHFNRPGNRSEIVYELIYTARPRLLRRLLHPVMTAMLKWETRRRLASLRRYLGNRYEAPAVI